METLQTLRDMETELRRQSEECRQQLEPLLSKQRVVELRLSHVRALLESYGEKPSESSSTQRRLEQAHEGTPNLAPGLAQMAFDILRRHAKPMTLREIHEELTARGIECTRSGIGVAVRREPTSFSKGWHTAIENKGGQPTMTGRTKSKGAHMTQK